MALPDWLTSSAQQFLNAYSGQVFTRDAQGNAVPTGLPPGAQQQTAGFTEPQISALNMIGAVTPQAQNVVGAGANQATATLNNAYLDPASNPWLRGTYGAAASDIVNQYMTATAPGNFAAAQRAGQFGSTAMNQQGQLNQYGLGQNLSNLAASIYGGNYQAERGRQLQALSMAPQTASSLYAPANTVYGAGSQMQQQNQTTLDTQYANAIANYEAPYNQLQGYGNAVLTSGGGGQMASTQTKSGPSVICTLLHKKGLVDDETYEAAGEFGKRQSEEVRAGYRRWAVPLTRAMDKSPLLMLILKPFWTAWQKEMFARVKGGRGSILGKILLKVGMSLCEWIGKRKRTEVPAERIKFRKSIMALQNAMVSAAANGTLKTEDYPLRHYFTPFDRKYGCFCYAREIFIPKGQIVIGKIHRHSHLNFILKGKVSVATEFGPKYFEAPCIFVSEVGLKRAVVTIEDTVWCTVHLTSRSGEKNLEAIEDELIAKSYEELAQ